MAEKKDEGTAAGCGCLILLVVIGFVIYKIVNWVSNNKETFNNGVEVAKQIGMWAAGIIVVLVVLTKIIKYRGRIIHWERKELQEYLDQNYTERWLSRGESGDIGRKLKEIESSLPQAERRLHEVQCMENETNERRREWPMHR